MASAAERLRGSTATAAGLGGQAADDLAALDQLVNSLGVAPGFTVADLGAEERMFVLIGTYWSDEEREERYSLEYFGEAYWTTGNRTNCQRFRRVAREPSRGVALMNRSSTRAHWVVPLASVTVVVLLLATIVLALDLLGYETVHVRRYHNPDLPRLLQGAQRAWELGHYAGAARAYAATVWSSIGNEVAWRRAEPVFEEMHAAEARGDRAAALAACTRLQSILGAYDHEGGIAFHCMVLAAPLPTRSP